MKMKQIVSLVFVFILAYAIYCEQSSATDSVLQTMEKEFIKIVKDVSPAIVEITAVQQWMQRWQSGGLHENVGTGIIFDKRGYIVTTKSVVGKADKIMVTLADERVFVAEMVGTDPATDVALVRIDGKDLPVATLGDSDSIQAGSWAITIGRSYGSSPTLSFGVVNGLEPIPGGQAYYDAIKINAAVSPGNSGGGVIDMNGNIVGIITAAVAEPRTIDFAPAIPRIDLKSELSRAKSDERIARAKLYNAKSEFDAQRQKFEVAMSVRRDVDKAQQDYISAQSQYERALIDIEVLLSQFNTPTPDSEEAGKLRKEMAETRRQLEQAWENEASLAKIKKVLDRKDRLKDIDSLLKSIQEGNTPIAFLKVQPLKAKFLGRQEESFAIPINFARQIIDDLMEDGKVERGWLGVQIDCVTHADMETFGLDTMDGVIVAKALPDTPADRAGVQKDDVIVSFNGKKVENESSLTRMVAAARPDTEVKLGIIRDKQKKVLSVKIVTMSGY